jgi:drug/metabolite transporter (DMT)-like permease
MTPFDIAYARIIGAAAILLPWGWWIVRKEKLQGWLGISPYPLRMTALVGAFGGLGYALLAYGGFVFAPATHASVLLPGSLPLWTTLVAIWLLHDKPSRARAMGLACILVGDLLVGGSSLLHAFDGGEVWKGDLLFMCGALCWSFYSVLVRRHGLPAVKATIAITCFAAMVYLPIYTGLLVAGLAGSKLGAAPWSEIVFNMLFQGVGSVVISGITFTKMVQHFGPVRSTMITALVPGLSALGAVLFLNEPMHWNLLAGLALVTLGITFGVRGPAKVPVAPGAKIPA